MNDTTASRPAGEGEIEGLESVKGTLAWLRSVADRDETVRIDGKALGRVLAAYDATLARQQGEIALSKKLLESDRVEIEALRESLASERAARETVEGRVGTLDRALASREGENAADCYAAVMRIEEQESRLTELQRAKEAVEDQNKRFVESQSMLHEQAKRADARVEAMRRAVEPLLRISPSLAGTMVGGLAYYAQRMEPGQAREEVEVAAETMAAVATALPAIRQALTAAQGEGDAGAPASEGHTAEGGGDRAIPHERAREAAKRLTAGSFRRDGEYLEADKRPQFSIPCRPEHDDDTVLLDYIKQQEAATLRPDPLFREAVGALGPFARFANRFGDTARDDDWQLTRNPSGKGNLTMGDVRRARSAHAKLKAIIAQGGEDAAQS